MHVTVHPSTTLCWPLQHVTEVASECKLAKLLLPTVEPIHVQVLKDDLPHSLQQQIESFGAIHGFAPRQTYALRRNMLKCTLGQRAFQDLKGNSHTVARALATAFETIVERHVRANCPGVRITTESDRKLASGATGIPHGPTPDLTFVPALTVNGVKVSWIDCKFAYGCYVTSNRVWQPESKMCTTASRYTSLFGRGAFVFSNGFCLGLKSKIPHALLLDASAMQEEMAELAELTAVGGPELLTVLTTKFGTPFTSSETSSTSKDLHTWSGPIFQSGNKSCQRCVNCGATAQRCRLTKRKCEWRLISGMAHCFFKG
tara:strand:+ start:3132 stop:4079 length:948 start_codon:yes stop_codon:yes gene_type:complete